MAIGFDRRSLLRLCGGSIATAALVRTARAQEAGTVPTVEAFAASPMVDQIALSPDGRRVALISQNQDNKVLIYLDVTGETSENIILGTIKPRGLMWADNNHVIIQHSQTKGYRRYRNEFMATTVVNLSTKQMTLLFSGHLGAYHYAPALTGQPYRVKIGSNYAIMASNFEGTRGHQNLHVFDMDDKTGKIVCEGSSLVSDWILRPDGHIVAQVESSTAYKTWKLNINRGGVGAAPKFATIHSLGSGDPETWPNVMGLNRDGTGLLLAMKAGDDGWVYNEMSSRGELGGPLMTGSADDDVSPLFHPVTWAFAGFARHDDWFHYDYSAPLLKKLAESLPAVMGDEYRCGIVDFADDPRKMIVYGESLADAGTYYFCDFTTGDVFTIFSNYPDLTGQPITEKKPFDYIATDGLSIHAYLTLPPHGAQKGLPLVVLPHGGPQSRDYGDFDWQAQCLASRGYVVLQPNFRGSTGYGEAFVRAGDGEFGRKMQTDLSDGIRHLAASGLIDPGRVAIMGSSYGGYAALAGATLDKGVYRCAISIAGISDPEYFTRLIWKRSYAAKVWQRRLGDPARYDEISPLKHAAEATCPILLLHGTDDSVVRISESERMAKALKDAGKPVEFITYKGQDHWETIGSARIEMMKAALTFLDKHNPAG